MLYIDRKEKNLNSNDEPNEEKNILKEKPKKPQIIFGKNPIPDEDVENEYVPLSHISEKRKKDEEIFEQLKERWKPSLDFQQQRSQSFFEKTTNVDNRKTVSISPKNYFTINVEGSTSREKAVDIANLVTSEIEKRIEFEKEKYLNVIGSVR